MRINRITPEIHAELKGLFDNHPELRLQNNGYEYLKHDVQRAKAKEIERIEEILREHVIGFSKFFNFRTRDNGEIVLRFDYNWGAEDGAMHFIGVGYLPLDQLLNGFDEAE